MHINLGPDVSSWSTTRRRAKQPAASLRRSSGRLAKPKNAFQHAYNDSRSEQTCRNLRAVNADIVEPVCGGSSSWGRNPVRPRTNPDGVTRLVWHSLQTMVSGEANARGVCIVLTVSSHIEQNWHKYGSVLMGGAL